MDTETVTGMEDLADVLNKLIQTGEQVLSQRRQQQDEQEKRQQLQALVKLDEEWEPTLTAIRAQIPVELHPFLTHSAMSPTSIS